MVPDAPGCLLCLRYGRILRQRSPAGRQHIIHHKGGLRIDTVFTFDPVPAGTTVSIEFELHSQGLPPALLSPLEWAVGGKVRHALSDLDDLKQSVEQVASQ